jgi:hypothetical protein
VTDNLGILQQLAAAYPAIPMNQATIVVYARGLASIPSDQLQMVVDQAIATSKFLPTVAELKRMRADLGLEMTAEERKRAYCPDSLRGIAIGCDEVWRQRDQRQLTANGTRYLEAV